jgi:transposase
MGHARRARVIVLTAEGRSGVEIASMVGIAPEVVECIVQMALSPPRRGARGGRRD